MQRRSHVFLVTSILVVIISRFQPHRGIDHSEFCCNYTIKKFAAWIKLKFSCRSPADIMLIDARWISHSAIHKILNAMTEKYFDIKMLTLKFSALLLFARSLKKFDKKFRVKRCFYRISVCIKLKDYRNSGYIQIFNLTRRCTGNSRIWTEPSIN